MKFQFEFPSGVLFYSRFAFFAFGLLLVCIATPQLLADDSSVKYPLKPEHGPWLVFAMSFDGHNSKIEAEQLATELRRDFKLQAYCTGKKLDFSQPTVGAGFDKNGNTRKMKVLGKKGVDGTVVLVGDFDSYDSQAIKDTLANVKKILKTKYGTESQIGLNLNAFTTRNPLLPDQFFKTPEFDQFVKKLNEERAH